MMISQAFVGIAAAIALILGTAHLIFTFFGPKLRPRDPELEARMKAVSPVITSQTTMWKTWIGFNATHSLGILLFGLVYGYLALQEPALLFHSVFLGALGGVLLLSYVLLAKAYFFSTPFRGISVALACYVMGFAAAWA